MDSLFRSDAFLGGRGKYEMPEETPFDKYIQQLEFTPDSTEWHGML
jgi:hypothetical protein